MVEDFEVQDVDAGQATVHLRIGGTGPPLLLLHGAPQTHVTWHAVARRLAEHFTVLAADLRGYGASSMPGRAPDTNRTPNARWRETRSRSWRTSASTRSAWPATTAGAVTYRLALDHRRG
jgi:haloacetate dehalogenase